MPCRDLVLYSTQSQTDGAEQPYLAPTAADAGLLGFQVAQLQTAVAALAQAGSTQVSCPL